MNGTHALFLLAAFIFIVVLVMRVSRKEGFSPGIYPLSMDTALLADWYKQNPNPRVDGYGAEEIFVNYPVFPAKHCGTNNLRYWRRPTNGKCTPPGMCMGLYEVTPQDIPGQPQAPSWSDPAIRVNYYESAPSACAAAR